MARASIRASSGAWACSGWRSGSAAWAGSWRSIPNRAAEPASRPSCRSRTLPIETDTMPIRILLADDHTVVRDGLRALLERQSDMVVVAEAGDGRDCVRLAEEQLPDVIVMDIAMPNMNGIEATRRVLAANPRTAVVILSMHQDESYVLRSLKAGAKGYLLKDSLRSDILDRKSTRLNS